MTTLLEVRGLTVAFRSGAQLRPVLNRVSFTLPAGGTIGLVGESGSGKSLSCLALLGLLPPQGRVLAGSAHYGDVDLLACDAPSLRRLRGNRIAMIFQDPQSSLNPCLDIATQLTEHLRLHRGRSRRDALHTAQAMLSEVGIAQPQQALRKYPHQFSGGQRQRLMIAMALITDPQILIADEPTTALDLTVQAQILRLLKRLQRKRGLSMIFVSHDLSVISQLADHIVVMHGGQVVETGTAQQILTAPEHPHTRQLLDALPPAHQAPPAGEVPVLEVRRLYVSHAQGLGRQRQPPTLRGIDLQLHPGEVLGLIGESGCGKSTLAHALMGLLPPDMGEIRMVGRPIVSSSASDWRWLRQHMQIVFQNPYGSLNPRLNVREILAEPLLLHRIATEPKALEERIEALLEEVDLPLELAYRYPHQLSGGQRQRVAIARAVATAPEVLIADEPTSALDVIVQGKILRLLMQLSARRGLAILFISHDLRLIRTLCDRLLVMHDGMIVEHGETEQIFSAPQHPLSRQLVEATRAVAEA